MSSQKLRNAVDLHRSGRLDSAKKLYEELIAEDPHNTEAMSNLAVIAISDRDFVLAERILLSVLEIKKHPHSYSNLGVALKAQGRLSEAIIAQQKAIELDSEFADAYHNLGNALREQGQAAAAVAAYGKVVALKPKSSDALNCLGNALKDEGRLEEAKGAYTKAIELGPENAEAYNNYAAALQDERGL